MAKMKALLIGAFTNAEAFLAEASAEIEIERISDKAELKNLFRLKPVKAFQVIFCAGELPGMSVAEMGQTLRMLYPEVHIYFIYEEEIELDINFLKKNGFSDSFFLPFEETEFKRSLQKALVEAEHKMYAAITLVDVKVGTKINFELKVYLPKNNRFVTYSKIGDILDESRRKRLDEFRVNSIFVPNTDIQNFYDYSAQRLLELATLLDNPTSGENEKALEASVEALISGLLKENYEKALNPGKKNIDNARKIIEHYLSLKYPGDWQKKLGSAAIASGDILDRSRHVAAYAVLFSMVFHEGDQKELVTAGMLQDVGLASLPKKLQNSSVDKMTPEEFDLYKTHPELSIRAIEEKNFEISDLCIEAIQYHHERWGGGGFPFDLAGSSLATETQILALANRFEELTRVEKSLTPLLADQAIAQMERESIADPKYIQILQKIFFIQKPTVS